MDVEQTSIEASDAVGDATAEATANVFVDDVVISWDGLSLAYRIRGEDAGEGQGVGESFANEQVFQSVPEESASLLPRLPENIASVERIYWPLEHLLVRTFSLPLSEVRYLDAAILSQELAELSGEDSQTWWLAWHAEKTDTGIAGIVFGLPQYLRSAMIDDPVWQQCPQLFIDGWERLTFFSRDFETCAVIDEDAEGIFFGFLQQGVWRGIRRINRKISDDVFLNDVEVARQIQQSWEAMGFTAMDNDSDNDPNADTVDDSDHDFDQAVNVVVGRVGQALGDALMSDYKQWQVEDLDVLPDRHHANFAIETSVATQLNFRHGKWAVQKSWHAFKQWKRPLAMAAGLLLIWLGMTTANLYSLERQADMYRSNIESAFHRGLPNEQVMLDPLAQLKKAGGVSVAQQESQEFLEQLQVLSEVYQKTSWKLREFSFRNGNLQMSGSAKDIDLLNKMRDQLQQKSGRKVVITDTDLSDKQVSFRMKW